MACICQCGLALTIIASVLQESRNKFNFIPSSTRHAYRIKKKEAKKNKKTKNKKRSFID
jgi:hypothetical protein